MAGHYRLPPHSSHHHHHHHPASPQPSHSVLRVPPPPSDDPRRLLVLEDHIATQHRDLQNLLSDNQHLAATHIALKQELAASRQDLRLLADNAVRMKAETDAEVRALLERSVRAEEAARRTEAMRDELAVVQSDVVRLRRERDGLVERLEKLKREVDNARADSGRVQEVKREIDFMRNEIERGRYNCILVLVSYREGKDL